jgi:integrase
VHDEHARAWKNKKHSAQWIGTLAAYAFPVLGDRRVNQIDTPEVLRVLSPIWLTKPETARRVKQRIGVVLAWAKAAGFRAGDNPVDGVSKGLPRQPDRKTHHAALAYCSVADFIRRLRPGAAADSARLAFEFLILTAARTGEVLGARWAEIDFEAATWTIPASRMKAGREHRVPLGQRCMSILYRTRHLSTGSEFVFPGRSPGKPMSNMIFLMTLRRMRVDATAHGFRSAFRDWAAERTNFPREVCEMALAHTIKNKVEAAYRRGDLLEKRRQLMEAWEAFVTPPMVLVMPIQSVRGSTSRR